MQVDLVKRVSNLIRRIGSHKLELSQYPLKFPRNETIESIYTYLSSYQIKDQEFLSDELDNYLREDLKRFLYTLSLVPKEKGNLLEIGANPYFISMLLKKYRKYKLYYTNYFEGQKKKTGVQYKVNKKGDKMAFRYCNVNIERNKLPFTKEFFDLIILGEVIEHFALDPLKSILEIKRVLKKGGTFILTTPNASRKENVIKMIQGVNIYDLYSSYGIHGRHNREYNKHELYKLLKHAGFKIDIMFSADVHKNYIRNISGLNKLFSQIKHREHDLGQYIFVKAINTRKAESRKPRWLYKSFPSEQMCD
jgi:SAM-dependent methyltransferase